MLPRALSVLLGGILDEIDASEGAVPLVAGRFRLHSGLAGPNQWFYLLILAWRLPF